MFSKATLTLAARVLTLANENKVMIATAESCTGGLIAGALTEISGSSAVVDRGFVTYSNAAKMKMLGVPQSMLNAHGAVSAEVAGAMALGALKFSDADLTVAVTGVAGPNGGTASKPVGLVHFAVAMRDGRVNRIERQFGSVGRDKVRQKTVDVALGLLAEMLERQEPAIA